MSLTQKSILSLMPINQPSSHLLLQAFKILKDENKKLIDENLELKDKIRIINKDLSFLESLFDASQQELLMKNFEITGVNETKCENLIEKIITISESVGAPFTDAAIDDG
jgi:hypothetical protein